MQDVTVEDNFHGLPVDAIGKVHDRAFVLYFTHPGRSAPTELLTPPDKSCGVIAISLQTVKPILHGVTDGTRGNSGSDRAERCNILIRKVGDSVDCQNSS